MHGTPVSKSPEVVMLRRAPVPLLATLFLVAASLRPADACSCAGPGPACQATWDSAAVFVGTVVEAQPLDQVMRDPANPFSNRLVRLRVVETFRGPTTSIVDVYTGLGGGDCGYSFVAGHTYLVYASQSSGRVLHHQLPSNDAGGAGL